MRAIIFMSKPISLFWFRRDLRLDDNEGLFCALTCGLPALPAAYKQRVSGSYPKWPTLVNAH